MALFSVADSIASHRVRFVLAEKGINVEIVDVDPEDPPEDLVELNPEGSVPTLVDRDLVLYDAGVVNTYLDERYPHPPLMPVDPVSRARLRLADYRLMHDWYSLVHDIQNLGKKGADQARKKLAESVASSDEVFSAARFFLHDELTLLDTAVAPLVWRLPHLGVKLPRGLKGLYAYEDRVFGLDSFQESLTEVEREMR